MTFVRMYERVLTDAADTFEVLVFEPANPLAVVLFAVGAGGDPSRHLAMLHALATQGCRIAAPRFARLASSTPSADELGMRARRLHLAFEDVALPHLHAAGLGHSIGATLVLILAGAKATTFSGETFQVGPDRRFKRLALMAPATDFFRAPDALQDVMATIVAWVGTRDQITPPETANILRNSDQSRTPATLHRVEDAGHFSFMNTPPPHANESLPDRDVFLKCLAEELASFMTNETKAV